MSTKNQPLTDEHLTQEEVTALACAYVEYARERGFKGVCWPVDTFERTRLGISIVLMSWLMGYPLLGCMDRGVSKGYGTQKRYEGHGLIPGKTLYV